VNEYYTAPHSSSNTYAVVSTLYSDSYAIAVAVLGHSARNANVSARLLLPYLKDRISLRALCIARAVGWEPHVVPFIPPPHNGKDIYHRFTDQYTKLNIWSFDALGVDRLVYLDADTLVRRNFDELFDSPFNFAAVPDVYGDRRGFSITFNAGVLALRPSTELFRDMRRKIETAVYPLGEAEQAFLNLYFGSKTVRLPYVYNANLAIKRRSPALWDALKEEMRIVHYTTVKPFVYDEDSAALPTLDELDEAMRLAEGRDSGFYADEVRWWKEAYERMMADKGDAVTGCYSL
jgi:glycogenin glucosyltransferase